MTDARERESPDDYSPTLAKRLFVDNPASHAMVDVLRALDVDRVASNPAASFGGLHESIVNYAGNKKPELLTCPHEESTVRAMKIAMTPPMGPTVITAAAALRESNTSEASATRIAKLTYPTSPQGESAAVNEAARMLVAAGNPLIIADRLARTAAGMERLIELAELMKKARRGCANVRRCPIY